MKILTKYVLKEHIGPLMFALCALTSLLLLNYISKQLKNLAGKGLPWEVILEFLALSVPFTVAMTLPMAVLVAVLYAFSRLTSENEIPAMKANGISMGSLLVPVAICAVMLAVLMVAFNDQVLPRANHRLATLLRDIAQKKPTFALREQVLNDVLPGRGITLRSDAIDRARSVLYGVHIYDMSRSDRVRTVQADSGHIALTPDQRDLVLTLYHGYIVDVDPTHPSRLNRAYFTANRMRIAGVGNELRRMDEGQVKGDREQSICEMNSTYQAAYGRREQNKLEIRTRMQEVVRTVVRGSGKALPDIQSPSVPPQQTWGSVYCDGLTALSRHIPFLSTGLPPEQPPSDTSVVTGADVPLTFEETAAQSAAPPEPLSLADQYDPDAFGQMANTQFGESIAGEINSSESEQFAAQRQMDLFAVEIHKKFSLAGACIVFVLIGVPFAMRFPRGGVGIVIGASLVIFAVSYVGLIAGEGLAKGGRLSPFLAMWSANFLLALVGAAMLVRMGKESASRGGTVAAFLNELRSRIRRRPGRRA